MMRKHKGMSRDKVGDSIDMWEVQNALDDAYINLIHLHLMDLARRVRELANRVVSMAYGIENDK